MITDKQIREAIKELEDGDKKFREKVKRHSQHKKVVRKTWAVYGCKECFKLFFNTKEK